MVNDKTDEKNVMKISNDSENHNKRNYIVLVILNISVIVGYCLFSINVNKNFFALPDFAIFCFIILILWSVFAFFVNDYEDENEDSEATTEIDMNEDSEATTEIDMNDGCHYSYEGLHEKEIDDAIASNQAIIILDGEKILVKNICKYWEEV